MSAVRIIGIGNAERGDDGLGPAVIAALEAAPPAAVQLATARGDLLALLDVWGSMDRVFLVDAVAPGGAPGRLVRIDASAGPVSEELGAFTSTHAFNLAETIELGRALGRLPLQLVIYGIEGIDFEPGVALSPAVQRALPELLTSLQTECEACTKLP
jgi:hydrogenase maturation protease